MEYTSPKFRNFAQSALIQNTNLLIDPNVYSYEVKISEESWQPFNEPVLKVDCWFLNNTKKKLEILLVDGTLQLEQDEGIRLYQSRKFTVDSLRQLSESQGFTVVDQNSHWDCDGTGFSVLLLRKIF